MKMREFSTEFMDGLAEAAYKGLTHQTGSPQQSTSRASWLEVQNTPHERNAREIARSIANFLFVRDETFVASDPENDQSYAIIYVDFDADTEAPTTTQPEVD